MGAKGLWGAGVGRYGDSTLADVTANSWGGLLRCTTDPGCSRWKLIPTPRLALYLNYGVDYVGRDD